ncbi:MAG TPA: SLBB domain-containing protein [Blastocatellia bacterium]
MLRRRYQSLLLFLPVWLITAVPVTAQPPAAPLPGPPAQTVQTGKPLAQPSGPEAIERTGSRDAEQSYRLGPGDLVDVRVFGRPELSGERRLDSFGRIRLHFIEEFQASCLTEAQLAIAITEKYRKYLRDPQIDVLIKEYRSQPVAIIGAVTQPGRFQLQRRVRLLELMTFAGGPSNRAGSSVHVIHSSDHSYCADESKPGQPADAAEAGAGDAAMLLSSIKMRDLLAGNQDANPYIQPGDIISIPEADQFFVTGSVNKPGAYPMMNRVTLTQAVAQAGGITGDGSRGKVRLIRSVPGAEQPKEIIYNIDDIQRRKIEDIALQANDIVEVPGSTAKVAVRNLLGVSINMLSGLPFFVFR